MGMSFSCENRTEVILDKKITWLFLLPQQSQTMYKPKIISILFSILFILLCDKLWPVNLSYQFAFYFILFLSLGSHELICKPLGLFIAVMRVFNWIWDNLLTARTDWSYWQTCILRLRSLARNQAIYANLSRILRGFLAWIRSSSTGTELIWCRWQAR